MNGTNDPFGLKAALKSLGGGLGSDLDSFLGRFDARSMTIAAFRAFERTATGLFGLPAANVAESRDLVVEDGSRLIPVRLYRGLDAGKAAPLIVYFHGGAFIAGSIASHDGIARALANAARAVLISVEYRLAPEHPWPAALEDALAVAVRARHRAAAHGADPAKFFLAGDSAGGTIATSTARLLGEAGNPPAGQLLFYPATDLTRARLFSAQPTGLGAIERRGIELFRETVLGADGDLADPNLSPLLAERLDCLPPAFIAIGGRDPLIEEVEDYGKALDAQGVPVLMHRCPAQPHGFLGFGRLMEDAETVIRTAGNWVHRQRRREHA